jgi:hypothetical protein
LSDPQNTVAAAPESQSSPVAPRYDLPDDWSGKGACPVCRTRGRLRVQHQDVAPDRIVCGACGVAFEVATAGARIRLAAVPPALAANTAELLDAWLTPAELTVLVERATPAGAGSLFEQTAATVSVSVPQPTPAPPDTADARSYPDPINQTRSPTAPLAQNPANGRGAEPDGESGSEDWFATLSAAIGGLSPAKPPPDSVLADELERALTSMAEPVADITAEPAPGVMAAITSDLAPPVVSEPAVPPNTPPAAPAIPTLMTAPNWVPAGEVAAPATAIPARAGTPSRRELTDRAWKLHDLGNSLSSIQSALESSRGGPDDIKVVMAKLVALEQARQARFRRNMLWALGSSLLGLVVLLAIAALVSSFTAQRAPAATSISPADLATGDAKKSRLPSWVSTLVPSSITVIDVPTPSIDPNGPPVSSCPTTSGQASALFGGQAASWNFNRQQQRWIFILADKPTNIRVPANMSAGYLVIGDNLEMRSVIGPATILNANFVAVSCD